MKYHMLAQRGCVELCENEWEESIKFSRESSNEFYRISKRAERFAMVKSILIIAVTQAAFILLAKLVLSFLP